MPMRQEETVLAADQEPVAIPIRDDEHQSSLREVLCPHQQVYPRLQHRNAPPPHISHPSIASGGVSPWLFVAASQSTTRTVAR